MNNALNVVSSLTVAKAIIIIPWKLFYGGTYIVIFHYIRNNVIPFIQLLYLVLYIVYVFDLHPLGCSSLQWDLENFAHEMSKAIVFEY